MFDADDETMAQLSTCLQHNIMIKICFKATDSHFHKIASNQLSRLKTIDCHLSKKSIASLSSEDDNICLLKQHKEQWSEFKKELSDVLSSLLAFDLA